MIENKIEIRVDEVFATPLTEEEQAKVKLEEKVQEALSYLVKTNHKFYIGYTPKENEDLVAIKEKRDEALLFIRDNDVLA